MSFKNQNFNFIHCDVFATKPYSGNSLAVFTDSTGMSGEQMLTITQELRHFESIFLNEKAGRISVRVFDLFEELPFAGHPIIGAACTLHKQSDGDPKRVWAFDLRGGRRAQVATEYRNGRYIGTLDQERPEMLNVVDAKTEIARAFNLNALASLPMEVISTGIKYLIIPVVSGLAEARITVPDLENRLESVGAEFAYLFDIKSFEGRHWNNDGIMEDVATGSAAGVVGAYALKHGLAKPGEAFVLKQGHFMGRPSEIIVTPYGTSDEVERITVAGEVAFVGKGELIAP
ncbi:PhzF family phenazine biosynthesis protein [Pseudaestuariivita rosea]|uniref:PhzF family phenazine biosynthesis protein n=1 Tax=Pseudaestuariivita rosea TaxID=2763263 RepID=UPI001ABA2052|nr:PhzF family phenazine biosynthesis protein [Pseudaestuariivita rosea]